MAIQAASSTSLQAQLGYARPPAIYVVDLFAAGEEGATEVMAQLATVLQDSSITKVLHDGRMVSQSSCIVSQLALSASDKVSEWL